MKSSFKYLFFICILILLLSRFFALFDFAEALKNIRFLPPLILLIFTLKDFGPKNIDRHLIFYKKLALIYGAMIFISIVVETFVYDFGVTYRNIVNYILMFAPLLVAYVIITYSSDKYLSNLIWYLFFGFSGIYFVELVVKDVSLSDILSVFESNIVVESEYETESVLSLLMGFFFLYFWHFGNKKMALIAFILTIAGAKRIAIVGTVVAFIFYMLYPLFLKLKIRPTTKLVPVAFIGIGLLICIFWDLVLSHQFDDLIFEVTGKSANAFFMGRLGRFDNMFYYLEDRSLGNTLFGYGIGHIENILYYMMNFPKPLHNDFYRLYLEGGFILFSIWLFLIGKYCFKDRLSFSITILLLVLMQTDNVFTYDFIMYTYYIMFHISLKTSFQNQSLKVI